MDIQSNNVDKHDISTSAPLVNKPGVQGNSVKPKLSELWEFGDTVSLGNKGLKVQSYVDKLVDMPEIREDRVEYARNLVENPDYPTEEVLSKAAEILAVVL